MKAVLLSLLLLVALSNCQVIPPNPVFNAVSSGANNTGTADNCLYQYWRFDASSATPDSYLFITVTDFVADPNQGVAFYVGKGFTPTAATNTAQCNTLNGNNNCILRLDCAFTPAIYTFVTTEVWGVAATNSTCKFNFTVTLATINPIPLGTVANLPSHRASSNITSTANDPFPPQWDHYTLSVSLLPQVFQGADLVINITEINGHGTPVTPFTGFLKAAHFTEGSAGTDCTSLLTCTAAVAPNTFCSFRIPYCSIVAGNYYLALKKELDGSSNWDYNITAYWDTRTVTPLTLGTAKYDEISDWAMEKYYSFSTTGLDEITVNVYDVAGGKLHWGASQTYVVTSTPGTCSNVMGCSTPYADACRDQYHFCPSPSATTTTNWFVTVRTDSRIPDNTRNRDFISYVIKATATSRTTKALNSPQFAVTGAVDQEHYDYYSFSVPAVIVNETFYIELYVDSTEDEAQLNKNYLMDNTVYAGPLLNVSGNVCQNLDWSCRTNQTGTTGNQRCYLQIPTCKLIPGTTIYFSVYGIKSQFYGIPVSYTLFGGLNTPMQLKDGISYQDQTNVNSYVHYLYRYSQTDLTPGDALLIEVTNIKQSTTTNVYVSFRNNLAGDCPCYQYDYFCQDAQECLFDTYQLFGGAGCKGLVPQDIYISVLGVTDAGLPNIGYTITITKYNWAGPINNLVAGNLVSGYVSDSENVYYWLDTSTITAAAPLMEFEVRFVEYIKNGNNDNEALTLYAMKDNLLTPTCAPFTCTTPRYTTTNGFSYCKVVLQPCQFDKSKNWYLVVRGSGGLTKGRAIHYTITANPVAVTPTTLANGVVVPGVVEYGQIQHYKYSVANNNNNRLYIEMYMDKDFARFVEFKVNFNYLASGSMCYNYTGSCTVITDYKTKCVYHIPNCQVQVGDYYFGVHLLNDFYDRPVPFTIAVYEKQEIIPIGDATDPAFGPVFTKLQRGEYQLFMFDATTGVNPGDIVYFEVDQVEHGNLTVVSSVDTPRGYCPCYGPIGSNTILDTTLTNYSLFNLACKGQKKFYFYLQPGIFYEESHIAFSVAIYVNRPPLAATLQKTQPLGVNGTTTKYTHRYFTIPQNAAAANSLIIYHFQTYNLTAPYAVLYGGKSYVNDKCGVTPLVDSPVQTMIQTLKPCDHTLDKNSYYFDVTATTNVSYAFNLWYDQIDPIPVAFNVTTNGSIPVADNHYDQIYVITPTIAVGSILKIRFTNFVSTATSPVMVTRNSIYDGSCTCADATPKGTLDQATGKLDIDIPYCDVTVGTYPFYITVKASGAVANYTLRWFVWNPVVTTINPLGNAGFFNTSAALTNVGDMAFYKLIIPASTASSGPYYWSVSIDTTTWALGNNFDLWVTTDGSSITLSTSCNLNLNCGGGNDGTCKVEECCVSGSAPAPLYITISAKNAGVTYNLNSLIAARFTPIVPITLNGPNVTQNVVSSGFGLTRVSGIKSDSIAIMKITAANYTGAPNVYQTQEQYQFPATNAGCLPPGNQFCTTPGFAAGACTEILECPKSQYTVSYNTLDAVLNTYNIAWQEVPAVALTLNPASPRNYTVTQDLIGKTVQFYVDLAGTQYDDLSDTLYINITTARGTFTSLDAYYNPATPAFATGTTGCTGGVTSFCTIAPGNDCAPKALQGCDVVPRGRIYIGVKLSDNTGSFLIGVYLVQLPRNPLQPTNNIINGGTPAYWLYTYSGQVSYLDMTFNSIQPPTGMTNSYSLWDSCASATPMLVDATKVRLYPCVLNNPPTSNGKVYFTTTSTQAQSNYTFTLAAPGVTVLPLDTTNTFYNTVDKDATYIYYSLVLPALQPFQRVDVTFTVSCGSMYVLENWNSIAWPDAFPPTGSPSPATCYRGFQNIDATTLAQATFTYSYSYCNWGPDRADRTIYYTVQGNTRLYTSLTQFTVVAKIAGTPPTMIQLPMRQDYLHNAVSNVIYWFETQTQAVGTQIYVRVSAPTNANIERLYGPWFEDASCEHSEMTMNNELWSGVAAYGWGDNGQTDCATASGITTCTYVIYPSEYRDGRYYIKLDSTAMGQQVRFFVWVERQGAVAITNDWSAYGSLGLKREYQYYAISTAGHSYVTIKVWNVTDGTLSLFLPEYQTAPFGGNPNQLYGRGATLGSYEATDSADTWDVTTGQYLVVPLGVCYFCTPYIYVAVRAKTFAVTTINTTVTYNIQFKFATPMAIPNDTVVCDTTNFKANETAYQLLLDWEDIWVVTAWTPNGEQYFHYDLQPTTQNLVAAFSPTGPSSQNSPTPGSDRCGYLTSQQSTFTTPSVGSYEDKCANNKFFISVISSAAAVASTYYLHPVVYNYPVAAYTLGTTYSGVGCGQTVYLKVPTTADATSYLNVDVTGTVTVKMNYGAVPDSSCASQDVRTMNPGNFNFADLCYLKTGTLYIVVTTTASNGPWTLTASVVTPPSSALAVGGSVHNFIGSKPYLHSVAVTPNPGQSLVISAYTQWNGQQVKITVAKDGVKNLLCGGTPWTATSTGSTPATVTLTPCDTAAATYYVSVEAPSSCSSTSILEYWITASLTTAYTPTVLTNAAPLVISTPGSGTNTNYFTFTPTGGSFLAVKLRKPTSTASATSLKLRYTAGNVVGYVPGPSGVADTCNWYTSVLLCTVNSYESGGLVRWCTAEVPPCSFSTGKLYGFSVTASDGSIAHSYELTVTQQTFTALTGAPQPSSIAQDANYYQITTTSVAALGIKLTVSSGTVEARVYTYCGNYDCNQYDQTFRCDQYEGECRLEFANAVSHPLSLTYYVKVSGTATYTIAALTGTTNNLAAGAFASNLFCYPISNNYSTWNYKNFTERDAEAKRLYNRWISTGKWNCPSQTCLKALQALACYYMFPAADFNGFLYDVCQSNCQYATQACGGNFTWAGFPEFDCANHFYKPAPFCTGAFPGCDGVPGSGKKYDICGVCGGTGSSCTTSTTSNPTTVNPSTTSNPTTINPTTTGNATTTLTTLSTTTGVTANATTTAKTTTTTTTTATTTSKATTTTTTSVGPTTSTTSPSVSAAFTAKPVLIFVMFAALVLLFLQA